MPESITQFYKRIQSCDLQPDATYSICLLYTSDAADEL